MNLNICCQKVLKKNTLIIKNNNINYKNFVQCKECGRVFYIECRSVEDEIIDLTANEAGLVESGKDGIKL